MAPCNSGSRRVLWSWKNQKILARDKSTVLSDDTVDFSAPSQKMDTSEVVAEGHSRFFVRKESGMLPFSQSVRQ